jgi:hypothetical protein
MVAPPDLDAMLARFRAAGQSRAVGEALLDQTLVAASETCGRRRPSSSRA